MKKIEIDGQALRAEMKRKNVDFAAVAEDAGFGRTYLWNTTRKNYIPKIMATILRVDYGINVYDFKPKAKQPTQNAELEQIIYNAVLKAIKEYYGGKTNESI